MKERLKVTALNKDDVKIATGDMEIRVKNFKPKNSLVVIRMKKEADDNCMEEVKKGLRNFGVPRKQYLILPPECEVVQLEEIKKQERIKK